jgi:sulfur carrier protein
MPTDSPGITLKVNGDSLQVATGSTLADLLKSLKLTASLVAVEHNLRVVPRAEHETLRLNHGDRIEIVTFVGGG